MRQTATAQSTTADRANGNRERAIGACRAGGLDSLGAVEYVNLIARRLNVQLPSTLV